MTGLVTTRDVGGWQGLRARAYEGALVRVRRGVYADEPSARELRALVAAALDRVDEAVASHRTAATVWRIPLLDRDDGRIHLTRPRRRQGTVRSYPGVVLHHAGLPAAHVTDLAGLPVTHAARTAVDLARRSGFREAVVTADAVLRRRLCSRDDLRRVAADCAGWPGTRRARDAIAFADPASASPLESLSRVAFAEHGLPAPQLQAEITPFDVADFLWPAYRVVGEADGLSKYTSPDVLRREKQREERFAQDGYAVVRWTWDEVFHRPDAVALRVLDVLRRRGLAD